MKRIITNRPEWFLSCLRSRMKFRASEASQIRGWKTERNVTQEFQSTHSYSPDYFALWLVRRPGGIRARARLAATKNLGFHRWHAEMETPRCFQFVPAKKSPGCA